MTEQTPPTVSSLRVEKPGKSKFAPVISGERRKVTTTETPILDVSLETPPATPTVVVETETAYAAVAAVSSRRQTTIEAVAARRERRRSLVADEPTTPLSAAMLPTLNFTAGSGRVTMAHFLRDTGLGIPMTKSGISGGGGTSRPAVTRSSPRPARSVATAVIPQVRIVDGNIVVDEDTPIVSTEPVFPMDVVNESGRHLTSHAFLKTIGNNRWSRADTDLFHDALSMCGTDFAMISLLFPKRSREQVKGKYKIEERTNPARVALSLKRRKPLDIQWVEKCRMEREEEEERKPGRPKLEGMDSLLGTESDLKSAPNSVKLVKSINASPTKSPKSVKSSNVSPTKSITTSPKKSLSRSTLPSSSLFSSSPLKSSPFKSSPRKSPRIVANKQS